MKFLEGKNPAERKKIIAAIVLGVITICALFYTFVLSGSGKKSGNNNKQVANTNSSNRSNTSSAITKVSNPVEAPIDDRLLEPIPANIYAGYDAPITARNIFAIYEPPPRPINVSTPEPKISPIPSPTPYPIQVTAMNPSNVYARTGDFTLDVAGDKFTPDSKILFNGMEVPTQFQNGQRLTAQVSAQLVAGEGQRQITVRKPNGEVSNPLMLTVQAPPVPNYTFVGLVARKRFNNDTALLQHKTTKEYVNVRLNDPLPDRFRVVSISSREVVVMDTALKLSHRLPFIDEKNAGKGGAPTVGGRPNPNPNPNFPAGFDPNVQYQQQTIPGIPDNIPRYVPPQQPNSPGKNDNDDEDDNDPNQ